jgi:hypothetical protein
VVDQPAKAVGGVHSGAFRPGLDGFARGEMPGAEMVAKLSISEEDTCSIVPQQAWN